MRQAQISPQKGSKWSLLYNSYVSKIYNLAMIKVFSIAALERITARSTKVLPAFDLFTFFCANLIQSEASSKLSSTSDWLMSA